MQEAQDDEREVLLSIYDGDTSFKQHSPTVFQYKYGDENESKSFLLEISWPAGYPDELPAVNMDTFYNKHLVPDVRQHIVQEVLKEAENNLGMGMTYTLFEWVKENAEQLVSSQPESVAEAVSTKLVISEPAEQEKAVPRAKKADVLSKAQKRKQWDRMEKGEKPRGHDWVDVIKHLSQTGGFKESSDSPSVPQPVN